MEKAKLLKSQIDALESFLRHNSKQELLEAHLEDGLGYGDWFPLTYVPFDTLATALYVGYELKKDPEDLIKETYDRHLATYKAQRMMASQTGDYSNGVLVGIRLTLRFLGKTIKGVND